VLRLLHVGHSGLWLYLLVMSWLWREACNELTSYKLTIWQDNCMTTWLCSEFTIDLQPGFRVARFDKKVPTELLLTSVGAVKFSIGTLLLLKHWRPLWANQRIQNHSIWRDSWKSSGHNRLRVYNMTCIVLTVTAYRKKHSDLNPLDFLLSSNLLWRWQAELAWLADM